MKLYFTPRYFLVLLLLLLNFSETNAGNELALKELSPEAAPIEVKVLTSVGGALTIRWEGDNAGVEKYFIETSTSATGKFESLASIPGSQTFYRHTGLAAGQKMFYRIRSFDGEHYSAYSQVVSGTTRPADYVYKIMPLGDSNTEGHSTTTDNKPVPVEHRAAYRSNLYNMLTKAEIKVDYVGSRKSGKELVEDDDHAGFPGLRDNDIANILRDGSYSNYMDGNKRVIVSDRPYLEVYNPDIILLHIGTNSVDGRESGMNDLIDILDQVDAYEEKSGKEVTVILSKIILRVACYTDNGMNFCPYPDENQATISYNNYMGSMAARRIAAGDRLVLVDMADANIDYRYTASGGDMADPLHPTQAGYDKMSNVWFNALATELAFNTLPVELVSFNAKYSSKGVELTWKTASEKDNSHFVVQRLQEGEQFEDVAEVAGTGNSSISKVYTYLDETAPSGTLYYRLKQVDFDGKFSMSKVVAVENKQATKQADFVFPNPGEGRSISLEVHGFSKEEPVNLLLTDGTGRKLNSTTAKADGTGTLATQLDFAQQLPPGLYLLNLSSQSKNRSLKVIVR
ncbi:SGNH/GDSL hydrolase family protein [Pontibacter sp. 13R65]|uniref:SGNH/GDSL hydrolase family protein n=1 Tax=Pontibacter sp. 13R65 TaxID=3127458 RepID=UPI00301CAAF6